MEQQEQARERITRLGAADRAGRAPAAVRPPTLRVAMDIGFSDDPGRAAAAVHVHVSGARPPVRVHIYVDGDLAAVQCGTGLIYDLPVGRAPSGRHTVTVRASDALGRWADTSMLVDLPLSESTLVGLDAPTGGVPAGLRALVARLWR